jgi:hypothetical protein
MKDEDSEIFSKWAFGEYFREFDQAIQFMIAWNKIHGVQLELHPDGEITKDIVKMIDLWKHEKNN